jgi:2-methylcitrate dehydratase PrpD
MLTERLAEFIVDTRPADLPPAAVAVARDALVDTVGCALAGSLDEVGEFAARFARAHAGKPEAAVWGQGFSTSATDAALANGIFSHALDFDDTHGGLQGHPSATIYPASLAVAELFGACGEALLAAHVIGLETGGKISRSVGRQHYIKGWHCTATMGVFAATAAAGRIAGLDVGRMRNALGIAASESSGLLRNFGTMTKPFHAGNAARAAVTAVLLAREGFTADTSIFDGDDSYLRTYGGSDAQPFGAMLDALGRPWEALTPGNCFKRWPCCYCNHRPVGALELLVAQHDIRVDEITAVEVGFPPGSDTALIHSDAHTGLEGKFCIEYVAAALLLDGRLTLETFTDPMVARPAARALMRKVRRYRIEDTKTYSGSYGYNDVLIRTARGEFRMRVDKTPGSPDWPMSEADHRDKFLDCAGRVLGSESAARLHGLLAGCGTLPDVRAIGQAMAPAGKAPEGRAQRVPA